MLDKFKPTSKPLKKKELLEISSVTESDVKAANRRASQSLRSFIRAE